MAMALWLHRKRGPPSRTSNLPADGDHSLSRADVAELEDTRPLLPHPLFSDHTGGDYELAQAWWDGYGAGHLDATEHPSQNSLCPYD